MNIKLNRIKEYDELKKGEEEIIKELNKPGGLEKEYKIYYLLDNNWVENFKNLMSNKKYKECGNILKVSLIKKKYEDKDFSYVHESFGFSFPYNFALVTQNFIDLLCKNFNENEQKSSNQCSFKIIIGGKCLIMKDKKNENSPFAFITLYNDKKRKFNNNIDYFLKIDNKEELKKNLNYILKNNIWNYFKEINYFYKDEYKRIINSEGKKIGYLVLNTGHINQIEEIYNYMEEENKIENKMNNINIDKFYSFLFCLYKNKEIYNELMKNYNDKDKKIIKIIIDFIKSKKIDDKIKEYFLESIKSNDYKIIINDIFEKINSELSNENKSDLNNQVDHDPIKAKKKFLEKNKNASFIKKLFFIAKETSILCNECGMKMYNFGYSNFFLIDLNKENKEISLNELFYKSEDISTNQKCNFCAGKTTNSIKKEKIFEYPEILIVILDGNQFNNFKLEKNLYILCNNGQDILYDLISFIESDTNLVYIYENNRWIKYTDINNKIECEHYNEKNPVVLFYKLTDRKFIDDILNDNNNNNNSNKNNDNSNKNNDDSNKNKCNSNIDNLKPKKNQTQIMSKSIKFNLNLMNQNNNFNNMINNKNFNNFNFNAINNNNNFNKAKNFMNNINFINNNMNMKNNVNMKNSIINMNNNINNNNNENYMNMNINNNLNNNMNYNFNCDNNNNINNNPNSMNNIININNNMNSNNI